MMVYERRKHLNVGNGGLWWECWDEETAITGTVLLFYDWLKSIRERKEDRALETVERTNNASRMELFVAAVIRIQTLSQNPESR